MCIGIALDARILTRPFSRVSGCARACKATCSTVRRNCNFAITIPSRNCRLSARQRANGIWSSGGNRDDELSRLPRTGWAREESVLSGKWRAYDPEPVIIRRSAGARKAFGSGERWDAGAVGRGWSIARRMLYADARRNPQIRRANQARPDAIFVEE